MGTGDRMLAGRYRIGAPLGQGGTACVLSGYDTRLERPVAVKRLRPEAAADESIRRWFEQQARVAARLTHPNAVALYDIGEDDGQTFLVMERLDARTLADRIAQGPLTPAEVAGVGVDVLAALRAGHALGMVHRGIKPSAILFGEEGQAKVAGFGGARFLEPPVGPMTHGPAGAGAPAPVRGAPAHLAPERLAGRPATAQADLFALGVVLFEALCGRRPGPAPVSVPGAPPVLAAVVLRALAPRPEDRYRSAAEMSADLQAAMATVTPEGVPAPAA